MKRQLLDILACPICKSYPLSLHVFKEEKEIMEGLLTCNNCVRWYPIIDEIPYMLPDELRDGRDVDDWLVRRGKRRAKNRRCRRGLVL